MELNCGRNNKCVDKTLKPEYWLALRNKSDLAEQIRELMFTFEDMAPIDSKQMQVVMKDGSGDMVLALKTASDAVKDLIFSSMSTKAAEMVRDDLEDLGLQK